jgi:sugar phosphate isomerase/epimerase
MHKNQSRRKFLEAAALATTGILIGKGTSGMPSYASNLRNPGSVFKGVQMGVITYSFRSMPGNIEQIVQYCKDSKVGAVELMGDAVEKFAGAPAGPASNAGEQALQDYYKLRTEWRQQVPMVKFEEVRKMFKDAGISIYGFKPGGFGAKNSDAELDYAFRAAKSLGANQVTVEFPADRNDTKRLGEAAAKHKIFVGYHGHTQQTFDMWDEALQQSKYNAINLDIGHYVAAGFDPIPLIKAKHDRIVSIHVKDRKSKANGGENMPWGEGDTPIREVLQLMSKNKYKFPATIELEYEIPAGSDAVREVAKCLEFARKSLEENT